MPGAEKRSQVALTHCEGVVSNSQASRSTFEAGSKQSSISAAQRLVDCPRSENGSDFCKPQGQSNVSRQVPRHSWFVLDGRRLSCADAHILKRVHSPHQQSQKKSRPSQGKMVPHHLPNRMAHDPTKHHPPNTGIPKRLRTPTHRHPPRSTARHPLTLPYPRHASLQPPLSPSPPTIMAPPSHCFLHDLEPLAPTCR